MTIDASAAEVITLLFHLGAALGLGILIGLERQLSHRDSRYSLGGVRTYAVISLFGFVSGSLSTISPAIPVVSLAGLSALLAFTHAMLVREGRKGMTSELAAFVTFLLGLLVFKDELLFAVAVGLAMSFVMSLKPKVQVVIQKVTEEELYAVFKFLVVSVLVLPLLPDHNVDPFGVLNPRQIWTVMVLVLTVSFAGYVLMKYWSAERGILLTGFLGGLVSSTVVTWLFSKRSRTDPANARVYGMANVLAVSIMYPRLLIVAQLVNVRAASGVLVPFSILCVCGLLIVYVHRRRYGLQSSGDMEPMALGNPFNLSDAVKFGLLFSMILVLVSVANSNAGTAGVYLVSALSGLASVDAMVVSLARLAPTQISYGVAFDGIMIAAASNNLVKLGIALYQGNKGYRATVASGIVSLLIVTAVWVLAYLH